MLYLFYSIKKRLNVTAILFPMLLSLSLCAQPEPSEKSFDEELAATKQLVVMLRVEFEGGATNIGAGIVVGREKNTLFIATAYHIVHRGVGNIKNISVKFKSNPGKQLSATLLKHGNEDQMDWALLSIKDPIAGGINPCAIQFDRKGYTVELKRSNQVYALGNPNGNEWAMPVAPDKISEVNTNDIVFQSSFISKGNSGGVLLDSTGKIIGMVIKDEPPFGRAINIDSLLNTIPIYCQLYLDDYEWVHYSLLHYIANAGKTDWIKYLLTDPCNKVNARDTFGITPLHITAGATSQALIESATYSTAASSLLLQSGADVNALDNDQWTPLDYAAQGNMDQVKLLLKAGADINGRGKKSTPLIRAIVNKQFAIEKLLIESGARLDKTDDEGYTPLLKLMKYWDAANASLMISKGARSDAKLPTAETALHLAARYASKEAVQLILKTGVPVNAKSADGVTPLQNAILNMENYKDDYESRIQLLLSAGADVDLADAHGRTAIDYVDTVLGNYTNYKYFHDLLKKYSKK